MTSLFNRSDFPMLRRTVHGKPLVYLDSAATALKPSCVIDAMTHFYQTSYATVHRGAYELSLESSALFHEVREKVRAFLGAEDVSEIVFTRGTTEGINLVARSYGDSYIKAGDEIVISGQEHHANLVPWQLLCERVGATLKVITLKENGEWDLESASNIITPRTKLVAITHVSNVLGIMNPIQEVITLAHQVGAKVLVDAAQSAVHHPLDVKELNCDFLVFSAHKLYGPTGVGILYGKQECLEMMPPYQGGGDMIQTVSFEKTTYQAPPLRFEAGTPMIAEVIGLGPALDYLKGHSYGDLHEHEKRLINEVYSRLGSDIHVLGPKDQKGSLITFTVPGVHPLDLATMLDIQGIAMRSGHLCAQPLLNHFGLKEAIRLSVAPYNTLDEMVYFCDTFKKVISQLRPLS
ncbi:SufS family cysteine desulfurase [Rhabdochlamydiaceae symbiont of Dictyostelium giganteum]|uniref:SufS family cysteine desulfurase n=1 Tax=Rhabdochlamydiaceae symbiont of Dictyostelium giganteum TaxID=3342349 RepID=UPI00384C8C22